MVVASDAIIVRYRATPDRNARFTEEDARIIRAYRDGDRSRVVVNARVTPGQDAEKDYQTIAMLCESGSLRSLRRLVALFGYDGRFRLRSEVVRTTAQVARIASSVGSLVGLSVARGMHRH
jgi:hypothetical protein